MKTNDRRRMHEPGTFSFLQLTRRLVSVSFLLIVIDPVVACGEELRAYPGEYVVTLERPTQVPNSISTSAAHVLPGTRVVSQIGGDTLVVSPANNPSALSISSSPGVRIAEPLDPSDTFCKDLLATKSVASCSPNYELHVSAPATNDPSLSDLWGLNPNNGIDAPSAWQISTGSSDTVVAVIDTGADYNHPDLRDNIWTNPGEIPANGKDDDGNGVVDDVHGFNATSGAARPGDPLDDNMHGTHVSGTIGAVGNNGVGVTGVAQRIKIMPLKFLGSNGAGSLGDAIKAIDYMVNMKKTFGVNVRVANNSWGGGGYSQSLADAIERARAAGIVFVAAAGNEANDNDANPSYPGSYEIANVVSVAAVDRDGNVASFSNFGATSVDVAAPGVSILSTVPNGQYATLSGTSMATPHVSGALGLLFSAEPALTMDAAITRLYESGRPLSSLVSASGPVVRTQRMVDVGRLLRNTTAPLPINGTEPAPCGYDITSTNLDPTNLDTAADSAPLVNQADEGSFYKVNLPFVFPFFRGSTDVIYLSPNGVVYTRQPGQIDYQVGAIAPVSAIAALHTDLIPTAPHHGVRVAVATDRVTVAWVDSFYAAQGQGEVFARMTLFPSGAIQTSVSFGPVGELVDLRSKVLGDPFATPATAPASVIGATGTSSSLSSSVDLSTAQLAAISSRSSSLILGTTMVPNCQAAPPSRNQARVTSIALRQSVVPRNPSRPALSITLKGQGSGSVPLTASINGIACGGTVPVSLTSGKAALKTTLPRKSVRVTLLSDGISKSVRVRSKSLVSRRASVARIQQMCRTVLGNVKQM